MQSHYLKSLWTRGKILDWRWKARWNIFKKCRGRVSRRLSENALLPKLGVILEKIILGISTICLWLFFQAFLDFEQNCYPGTAS